MFLQLIFLLVFINIVRNVIKVKIMTSEIISPNACLKEYQVMIARETKLGIEAEIFSIHFPMNKLQNKEPNELAP